MAKDSIFLDPEQVKKQKEDEEKYQREKKLRISDLRKILNTPEGRRMVWNELERAKVFADFFSTNALEMARFCGERKVGLSLLADIMEAKPEAFYSMYLEETSKTKSEEKQEEINKKEENADQRTGKKL